jgi:hypothetical protein
MATNASSQEKFLEGLNDEIPVQLVALTFDNDQFLVDNVAVVEGKQRYMETKSLHSPRWG